MNRIDSFRAFVIAREPAASVGIREMNISDLPPADVLIRVEYSALNYKDGLACSAQGKIVKSYPFIPGIDLCGEVIRSDSPDFRAGDAVLVTGFDLGVAHFGGFSEYARVPAEWVVRLPSGLTPLLAMTLGTAGLTAALSIYRLEQHGLTPDQGPVLVTGATGGVGSLAVAMLANRGYEVEAVTGKSEEHEYLRTLGAGSIVPRDRFLPPERRPLDRQRWAGCVDPVGGDTLAYILSSIRYGGAVAVSGLTGGSDLPTSVYPFILRGISLFGIDSVYCPLPLRRKLWEMMADEFASSGILEQIGQVIALEQVPVYASLILQGAIRGRIVVRPRSD